jgi:hypothetical protein
MGIAAGMGTQLRHRARGVYGADDPFQVVLRTVLSAFRSWAPRVLKILVMRIGALDRILELLLLASERRKLRPRGVAQGMIRRSLARRSERLEELVTPEIVPWVWQIVYANSGDSRREGEKFDGRRRCPCGQCSFVSEALPINLNDLAVLRPEAKLPNTGTCGHMAQTRLISE